MAKTVLVTGVSGFIAKHVALAFLEAGYDVRGTIRSLAKADQVRETLGRHADAARLALVEADLTSDAGWDDAMSGVDAVAHLASPFPPSDPKDENELIRPAVDGTMRVLRAAARHNVPRLVQTSSVAAVAYGHPRERTAPFTEDDWSNLNGPGATAYIKSKTLAERAAREFAAGEGQSMHYASVNPGLVLGPALDRDIGTSVDVVRNLLAGRYPGVPRIFFGTVDVRDVATMHVRAIETAEPSGGRYLAVAGTCSLAEISLALRAALGDAARKAPTRQLPDAMVRLVALFDAQVRSISSELSRKLSFDNSRTRQALGIDFIPPAEAAVATARSLIELGLI